MSAESPIQTDAELFIVNLQGAVDEICKRAEHDPEAYRAFRYRMVDMANTIFDASCKLGVRESEGADANDAASPVGMVRGADIR